LAVNACSRISVGRALCNEIAGKLCVNEYWEHDRSIFFGTFIPSEGLVTNDTRGIDLCNMKQRLRADLRGLSYIGMLEPGLYVSLPLSDRVRVRQAISWHPHVPLWGQTLQQVAGLTRRLRKSGYYQAVVEELKPVEVVQVANGYRLELTKLLDTPISFAAPLRKNLPVVTGSFSMQIVARPPSRPNTKRPAFQPGGFANISQVNECRWLAKIAASRLSTL